MKLIYLATAAVITISLATDAQARKRSKKDGFHFGATIVSANGESDLSPNESSNKDRKISSTVSGLAPHVGYSFGTIGLGMRITNKTENTKHEEIDANNKDNHNILESTVETSDLSFFTRVNFGRILFLEAGIGIYNQKTLINNRYIIETSSSTFVGEKEEYKLDGIGSGHHTAIGFEVPVGNGFYFTGDMTFKNFEVRAREGGPALGDKQSTHHDQDLNFGFSYFFQ
jgi:hypothetical protein